MVGTKALAAMFRYTISMIDLPTPRLTPHQPAWAR